MILKRLKWKPAENRHLLYNNLIMLPKFLWTQQYSTNAMQERKRENRNDRGLGDQGGNKHLIQHHSSSSCLFTPAANSIWLLPPLDSTALHTPFPMCTLHRASILLPVPPSRSHPHIPFPCPSATFCHSSLTLRSRSFCVVFIFPFPFDSTSFLRSPNPILSRWPTTLREKGWRSIIPRSSSFPFDPLPARWFSVYFPLIRLHLIYSGSRAPFSGPTPPLFRHEAERRGQRHFGY